MSSHLLVIALVLAPILLTGAVGDSGREGQGNNPGECCGCPPGRNGTSNLLFPLAGEQPPAQSPRALPEPPCLSRPAGAGAALSQLRHGGCGFSLRSEADGMKSLLRRCSHPRPAGEKDSPWNLLEATCQASHCGYLQRCWRN